MSFTLDAAVAFAILTTGIAPEDFTFKDVKCVAEAVNWEAGNQPQRGKEAVAHVVLNRVNADGFKDTPCGVVNQRGAFSYHRIKKAAVNRVEDINQLKASAIIALQVLAGKIKDPTGGALYFVNLDIATNTSWLSSLKKVKQIGEHTFYKEK